MELMPAISVFPVTFLICVTGLPSMDKYLQLESLSLSSSGSCGAISFATTVSAASTSACVFAARTWFMASSLTVIGPSIRPVLMSSAYQLFSFFTSDSMYHAEPTPFRSFSTLNSCVRCPASVASTRRSMASSLTACQSFRSAASARSWSPMASVFRLYCPATTMSWNSCFASVGCFSAMYSRAERIVLSLLFWMYAQRFFRSSASLAISL